MKIIIIALSFLLMTNLAAGVRLEGKLSVAEEYSDSQSVFIGKVIAKADVPASDNYYDGHNYTVQVQEVFKGNPTKPIVIFSENSSGRFPIKVGKEYIIFIYYELGRYQIDNCGNSGLLSDKQHVVQAVRQFHETMIK